MKRKHADRLDWHRILNKDFVCRFFDEVEFKGHITLITIHQVKEPLKTSIEDKEIALISDNVLSTNFVNYSKCRVFVNLLNYPAR